MRHGFKARRGFTLIELMIVVAVIAVLTLIAVPKFASLIQKANESGTRGHLTSVRSAIRLYYMDNEQVFPPTFAALRDGGGKYLSGSIPLFTGYHPVVGDVDDLLTFDSNADVARWAYISGGTDAGVFKIQCTHTDTGGKLWSSY
jgi:prepilin-type N-terminal cleavage/methylation domain-containing protein